MTDIASLSDLLVDEPVGAMVEAYDTGLRRIVEHHAPLDLTRRGIPTSCDARNITDGERSGHGYARAL